MQIQQNSTKEAVLAFQKELRAQKRHAEADNLALRLLALKGRLTEKVLQKELEKALHGVGR